jgi:hypothetical protein
MANQPDKNLISKNVRLHWEAMATLQNLADDKDVSLSCVIQDVLTSYALQLPWYVPDTKVIAEAKRNKKNRLSDYLKLKPIKYVPDWNRGKQ